MAYVYQPYPRHLHKPRGAFLVVHSDEEQAAALKDGWSRQPVADAPPVVEPAPEPVAPPPAGRKKASR